MAARRGNTEGALYKRQDGRWEAKLRLPDGSRKSVYGETKAEAIKELQALQRKLAQGTPLTNDKLTVGKYLKDWLDGIKPGLEYATWNGYEQHVRLHLIPALGTVKLHQLTPQQLQKLYAEKLHDGKSPTTVRHLHATLHKALEDGLRFGLIQRNVASLVKAPAMAKHPMRVYTPEQARKLLEAARGERLEALYVLALTTGMREGELLGLTWRDVDLGKGVIRVQQALKKVETGRALGKPKNTGSRRKIMLTPTAITALTAHHERQDIERAHPAWQETGLVFVNTVGNALDPSNLYHTNYQPLLKRAGLPFIRFHDLRHSAATLLLLSGVHPKVVSEMMGHSSINITLNLYSHVLPDMQASATSAMESLLQG